MPTLIAGVLGGTASAASYKWAHLLQIPILLVLNGALAVYYWRKGLKRSGSRWRRFGPLAIHLLGLGCVLVMPVSVVFTVDMKYGFDFGPVQVPPIASGGFEHHGFLIAVLEVIGVLCLVVAGVMGANVHETIMALMADERMQNA